LRNCNLEKPTFCVFLFNVMLNFVRFTFDKIRSIFARGIAQAFDIRSLLWTAEERIKWIWIQRVKIRPDTWHRHSMSVSPWYHLGQVKRCDIYILTQWFPASCAAQSTLWPGEGPPPFVPDPSFLRALVKLPCDYVFQPLFLIIFVWNWYLFKYF
jgi:hypothetical protein